MKLLSRSLLVAAVAAASLSLCTSAGASNVTVGPSLTGEWEAEECGGPTCTYANYELGGTGSEVTSPVTGAIVSWSVVDGTTAGTYRLRTMTPGGTSLGVYVFRSVSEPFAATPTTGVQTFSTAMPVSAGQGIALTASETASVGFREGTGRLAEWETEPPESGPALAGVSFPELAGFNAEVQPAPAISGLGTTSGPTAGGTSVTITGTDLENASAVDFGGAAAASFKAESESQLTAVAPANTSAASVSVSVTTVAGRASAPQNFTYVVPPASTLPIAPVAYCRVPKLIGKKLAAAKKALGGAKCKLGTVKKLGGATTKSGKIAKQGAKPKTTLPVGAKVAVTLEPPKTAKGKPGKK